MQLSCKRPSIVPASPPPRHRLERPRLHRALLQCLRASSAASSPQHMLMSAAQACSCTTAACGCARIAAVTASSAPASVARCLRAGAAASSPQHTLRSIKQPCSCTPTTCG
eukprot:scaffold8095_cov75-Phaeocystis_antarctica.AAC.4